MHNTLLDEDIFEIGILHSITISSLMNDNLISSHVSIKGVVGLLLRHYYADVWFGFTSYIMMTFKI